MFGQETLNVNIAVFVYKKTPGCMFNDPDQWSMNRMCLKDTSRVIEIGKSLNLKSGMRLLSYNNNCLHCRYSL